jgi:transposase InsO family protein
LPDLEGDKPQEKKSKPYPIGYFHIDIAEVHTEEGRLYLFVAIDRTCKFAYAELQPQAMKTVAAQFLRHLIAAVPYKIHTVLTDNGIQFTNRQLDQYAFQHIFARVCQEHGIEHHLTKTNHPWTNGHVERMNRTLKEAPVKRFYYQTHQQRALLRLLDGRQFRQTTQNSERAYPYEYICQCWQKAPERFTVNPCHHTLGLNI